MAKALYDTVREWELENCTSSLCFDTTTGNTGKRKGVWLLFEQMLKKDLLNLAFRYHVHAMLIQEVFLITMGPATGLDIKLFIKFRSYWSQLEVSDDQSGMEDMEVANVSQSVTKDM